MAVEFMPLTYYLSLHRLMEKKKCFLVVVPWRTVPYLKIFLCDGTGPTFLLNKVGTFEIALKTLLGLGELIMLK